MSIFLFRKLPRLKLSLSVLKNRVSHNELRLEDTFRTVEANERVQRSLNVRIYGYDFTRCKVPRPNEQGQFDVTTPAELVRQLMMDGMKLESDFADTVAFRKCHWVANRYILCSFQTADQKQKFEKEKYVLRGYAPHGRSISIKSDPTGAQNREFQDAATLALQLRAKGFVAYSTDNRIRVGPRDNSRWYHYTDPAIHSMLNPSG